MNDVIRKIDKYSIDIARRQWDGVAELRNRQLRSGNDVSFDSVLLPAIMDLVSDADRTTVLDIGCGVGVLTEKLAKDSDIVVGVDMSERSIALALASDSKSKNVYYEVSTLNDFLDNTEMKFSLVVGNMVLQDISDLDNFLFKLAKKCSHKAQFVATITHPWFWPSYWGYEDKPWYNYKEEILIEAPFKISRELNSIGITTHFHRPVEYYFRKFSESGFVIEDFLEPVHPPEVKDKFSINRKIPRFLVFSMRKYGI